MYCGGKFNDCSKAYDDSSSGESGQTRGGSTADYHSLEHEEILERSRPADATERCGHAVHLGGTNLS